MPGFIEDGFNLACYIAAAPESKSGERLWPAMNAIYRPATRSEVVRHDAEVEIALQDERRDPEAAVKAENLTCKFINDHLLNWDLKNSKGETVRRSVENMGRIHSALFSALYGIIRGSRTSDPKPPGEKTPASDESQLKNS